MEKEKAIEISVPVAKAEPQAKSLLTIEEKKLTRSRMKWLFAMFCTFTVIGIGLGIIVQNTPYSRAGIVFFPFGFLMMAFAIWFSDFNNINKN